MKDAQTYFQRFLCFLPPWLGWGAVCGSASFVLAILSEISAPFALCEMVVGIFTWSFVCAAICATNAFSESIFYGPGWSPLRVALVIRAIFGFVFGPVLAVVTSGDARIFFILTPDFWTGSIAINMTGLSGGDHLGATHPVGLVFITTLIQGAFVVLSILLLAIAVYLFRRLKRVR